MKELVNYIESLLLDHECVIVPGFGGFVTYYAPARKKETEHVFLPPYRTVGFNPALKINDGLLLQSYMQAHEISYPAALRMFEEDIEELRAMLIGQGRVQLGQLGVLSARINGALEFHPNEHGILSPFLYGLGTFQIKPLSQLPRETTAPLPQIPPQQPAKPRNTVVININRTWLNNVVAVAAAVVLFFVLSTPVGNTYVEPESYAFIGNASWFDQKHAPETAPAVPETVQPTLPAAIQAQPATTPAPAIAKETPAPVPAPAQTRKKETYHIIVGSVPARNDAEAMVQQLIKAGHTGASVVEGDGRARVAIQSGNDKNSLNKKMIDLRRQEPFKNAWLLTTPAK